MIVATAAVNTPVACRHIVPGTDEVRFTGQRPQHEDTPPPTFFCTEKMISIILQKYKRGDLEIMRRDICRLGHAA